MTKLKPNQFKIFADSITITERPILFSTEMVRANLEGRKTQTRRGKGLDYINECNVCWRYDGTKIKENPNTHVFARLNKDDRVYFFEEINSPYGMTGDLILVRETWLKWDRHIQFRASTLNGEELAKWKPSIHMPKTSARIWLMVEEIKVERLQDISEEDAIAEGCSEYGPFGEYRGSIHPNGGTMRYRAFSEPSRAFQDLWESINGEESWKSNPWVWVVKYRIISKTGKPCFHTIEKNYLEVTGKEVPDET